MNTKHFSQKEMLSSRLALKHGIDNTPEDWQKENLRMLFNTVIEPIRELYKKPIQIGNAFRNDELNAKAGGTPNSSHRKGLAADLWIPNDKHIELIKAILKANIPFHTIIHYPGRGFIHVDIRGGTLETPRLIRVSQGGSYPIDKIK